MSCIMFLLDKLLQYRTLYITGMFPSWLSRKKKHGLITILKLLFNKNLWKNWPLCCFLKGCSPKIFKKNATDLDDNGMIVNPFLERRAL